MFTATQGFGRLAFGVLLLGVVTLGVWAAPDGDPPPATKALLKDHLGEPLPPNAVARYGTKRWRHSPTSSPGLSALALSPDGHLIASANRTVRLWELATGKCLVELSLDGRGEDAVAVSFSPDGKTLTTQHCNGSIRAWQVPSGKPLRTSHATIRLDYPGQAFSADGKVLAHLYKENMILLVEVDSAKIVLELQGSLVGPPS